MLKKMFFVAGTMALLGALVFGRDAFSYLSTSVSQVRRTVKDKMPIGLEFERAQRAIQELQAEIKRNHRVIAEQEIEVAKLDRKVGTQREDLAVLKDRILERKDDLKTGASHYVYAGRTFSTDQVKQDLVRRFNAFKARESTLEKLEKILAARESALHAAREKVEAMLAARNQLEVDLADLQARQQLVEVHNANSEFNLDDSHLAYTREMLSDLESRIAVAEKLTNISGQYDVEVPFDDESNQDISTQVSLHFEEIQAEIESLAKSK